MRLNKLLISTTLASLLPMISSAIPTPAQTLSGMEAQGAKPEVTQTETAKQTSKTAAKQEQKTTASKTESQSDDDTYYLEEKQPTASSAPSSTITTQSETETKSEPFLTQKLTAAEASRLKIPSQQERYQLRLNHMGQDLDNPVPMPNWLNKIKIGGLVHIDAFDKTKPNFTDKRSNQINVAATKLNIQATVNDWIKATLGLFYASSAQYYYPAASSRNGIRVEDAYVDIVNFKYTPFYLRLGQQYLPFGRYLRYPILRNLPQELSEISDPAIEAGFVDLTGFYGAIFVLNGIPKINNSSSTLNNGGATLGYENLKHPLGINIGLDYLNNMNDVGAIEYNLISSHYYKRVGGFSAHLDLTAGPFSFGGRYVTALKRFSPNDFMYQSNFGVTRGAKPYAAMISAGYLFKTLKRDSKVELTYQWSREAHNASTQTADPLELPLNRMSVSYGVNIMKYTVLEFQYARDHDYPTRNGGTNAYDNIATLRLTVLF